MEPLLADLINNPRIPKPIRWLLVTLLSGALVFLFLSIAINGKASFARPFGILFAILFFAAWILLSARIFRSSGEKNEHR